MVMSFKNKLLAKFPAKYISYKIKDEIKAKEIIDGYNAIRESNLFDDDFYLNKYPKVKSSGMDPLLHYIFFGFDEVGNEFFFCVKNKRLIFVCFYLQF